MLSFQDTSQRLIRTTNSKTGSNELRDLVLFNRDENQQKHLKSELV